MTQKTAWKQEPQFVAPVRKRVLESGPVRLTVSLSEEDGRPFRYAMMSFGRMSEDTFDHCLETWPRDFIVLAREALDEFERQING